MTASLTSLAAWHALQEHGRAAADISLRDLLDREDGRFERYSVECAGALFDFSRHLVTDDTLRLLFALAADRDLHGWTGRLFRGERVNTSEDRVALHVALRGSGPAELAGRSIAQDVSRVLAAMRRFCDEIASGRRRGAAGRAYTDIVNLGIGGSRLGPELAVDALAARTPGKPRLHFVSNADGEDLQRALAALDPATTLFIVSSKTFNTVETMANARGARRWLGNALGEAAAGAHFAAVTANPAAARAAGIAADAIFEYWDWVGGRYSVWSAAGLPVALAAGMDAFEAMLAGAREMDAHFRDAQPQRNAPLLAGLIDIWYGGILGAAARVVLPYDERLRRLPEYLQQLEMESNGKRVARDGSAVEYDTAPVAFGMTGTNAQHTFFQLLHQGTRLIPADFIACCRPGHGPAEQHTLLLANFVAQTTALARGVNADEAVAGMRSRGCGDAEIAARLPHLTAPGNRPGTCVLLDRLDPRTLGALLAFYEHRTFVESVILGVNAFDQWGVEYGKTLSAGIVPELERDAPTSRFDRATNRLINHFKYRRRQGAE